MTLTKLLIGSYIIIGVPLFPFVLVAGKDTAKEVATIWNFISSVVVTLFFDAVLTGLIATLWWMFH